MRTLMPLLAIPMLLAGCAESPANRSPKAPGEDFTFDHTVRITAPTNGETVEGAFTVALEAGADVASVRVRLDDAPMGAVTLSDLGTGRLVLSADAGRHVLAAEAMDADGVPVSEHTVAFRVAVDDTPWVTITSPSDGDTARNPVRFTVEASPTVDSVELLADGWSLGTTPPDQVLTYAFTGTGFERTIEAQAYDGDTLVASDTITLTVDPGSEPVESAFNDHVLALMEEYPTDGSYAYWWPSGVSWGGNPHDIYYLGQLFSAGDPENRSFCVGLTFEVFMRAFDIVDRTWGGDGHLNGVDFDTLYDLRTDWYVRDLYGAGVVDAVELYGIGQGVTDWADVRPGDFVQFWRHSGSGHNAIFVDWERAADDRIIGFRYWSTQGSTDGVGENDEYFGSSGSSVDPNLFFVARVDEPDRWLPWQ